MADTKHEAPGFMTYREAAIMFSLMPECDAAKAIKATCDYYLYRTLPTNLTDTAKQVFKIMQADIAPCPPLLTVLKKEKTENGETKVLYRHPNFKED